MLYPLGGSLQQSPRLGGGQSVTNNEGFPVVQSHHRITDLSDSGHEGHVVLHSEPNVLVHREGFITWLYFGIECSQGS